MEVRCPAGEIVVGGGGSSWGGNASCPGPTGVFYDSSAQIASPMLDMSQPSADQGGWIISGGHPEPPGDNMQAYAICVAP